MSTKIYNGIKFKSKNWKEVLDQLLVIRGNAIKIGNESLTIKQMEWFITKNRLQNSEPFEIFYKMQDNLRKEFRDYNDIEFNFSVILYPSETGDIYGSYFSDLREYECMLNPISDEFAYYDNTDHPEEITYEEWQNRGDLWDKLVPGKFSDTGFIFDIVGDKDLDRTVIGPKINEVMSYIKRDSKIEEILK